MQCLFTILSTLHRNQEFKVYCLDSFEWLKVFSELIGGTSIFGIRKRKPKISTEATTRALDAMNIITRIDLYVSFSKVKVHLYASRHIAGVDTTNNALLLQHFGEISDRQELPQTANTVRSLSMSMLQVNSKSDYNGNV
jgi:hypothetical protein